MQKPVIPLSQQPKVIINISNVTYLYNMQWTSAEENNVVLVHSR